MRQILDCIVMDTYRAIKFVYRKTFKDDDPFEREFNGIRRFETVSGTTRPVKCPSRWPK